MLAQRGKSHRHRCGEQEGQLSWFWGYGEAVRSGTAATYLDNCSVLFRITTGEVMVQKNAGNAIPPVCVPPLSHEKGAFAADNESRLNVSNSSCSPALALKGRLCSLCEELPSLL